MANKEFQVRHGLVVGNNVLVANVTSNLISAVGTINAAAIQVNGATIPSGDVSNLVFTTVNTAFNVANAAFTSANNVAPQVAPAYNTANAGYTLTNTTYAAVNSAFGVINAAFGIANNALPKAGGTITGDLVVQGNTTFSGITTYANTQTLLIGDNILTLNADLPAAVAPSEDAGLEVKRGTQANVSVLWNEGSDRWTFTNDGTNYRLIASNTDVESANNYAGAMANSGNVFTATVYAAINSAFGVINAAYTSSNADYTLTNAAFAKANSALANTSGVTFAGNLYFPGGSKIGLGTTQPSGNVHIVGNDSNYQIALSGTTKGMRVETNPTGTILRGVDSTLVASYQPLTLGASYLSFETNGATEAMRITSTGNVGINTTSPKALLDVKPLATSNTFSIALSYASITNGFGSLSYSTGYAHNDLLFGNFTDASGYAQTAISFGYTTDANRKFHIGSANNSTFDGTTKYVPSFTVTSGGNVGIGTSSPSTKFEVSNGQIRAGDTGVVLTGRYSSAYPTSGGGYFSLETNNTDANNGGISFKTLNAGSLTERMRITSGGDVAIGVTSAASKLHVLTSGTSSYAGVNRGILITDTSGPRIVFENPSATSSQRIFAIKNDVGYLSVGSLGDNASSWVTDNILNISAGGSVGVRSTNFSYVFSVSGTSYLNGATTVNGAFSATTKSFLIDHPSKPGMKLRYGSLEGPENGVYLRGRVSGQNYIEYPDYWSSLVDIDTTTVQLTPIGDTVMPRVAGVLEDRIILASDNKNIDCYYYILAERKDVEKLVVEF